MEDKKKKSLVIHPFLFAIFPVIFVYANNIHYLPIVEIVIPLGISLGIAIVLWLVLSFPLDKKKSGFIVSIALVLFFTYGHLYVFLNYDSGIESELTRHRYLLPLYVGLFIIGVVYFVRTNRKLNNVTTILNAIAGTIVVLSLMNIAIFNLEREQFIENSSELVTQNMNLETVEKPPNIYYIILDAYAGDKVLKNIYGYDNSEFTDFLKNSGFYIPENARSNYVKTNLSIISALEMKHLTYLEDVAAESKDEVQLSGMVPRNKVMVELKNAGYAIVNFDSATGKNGRDLSDLFLCTNSAITNSELVVELARMSILHSVYTKIFVGDHRETILCMFSELPTVSQRVDGPVFVFVHFLLPHPPYIFGPNGESVTPESLELGNENWKNKEAYLNQVKFANKQTQQIVEKILEVDNDAVIIIQGDHGSQFTMDWDNPDIEMIDERMSILNAYHLPRGGEQFLYDSITPVNTFRVVFNAYLNGTYSYVEDNQYFSTYNRPFVFNDVTNSLIKLEDNG